MFRWFQWACFGGKFVVSRAGEAYDARDRGPNRKFRLGFLYSATHRTMIEKVNFCLAIQRPRAFQGRSLTNGPGRIGKTGKDMAGSDCGSAHWRADCMYGSSAREGQLEIERGGSPMAMKTKRLKNAKKLVATKPLKHKLAP